MSMPPSESEVGLVLGAVDVILTCDGKWAGREGGSISGKGRIKVPITTFYEMAEAEGSQPCRRS
jgi:hypothetical protein